MQEEIAKQFRQVLPHRYGRFYSVAQLSPEQIETFERAMINKFDVMSDVIMATRTVGASDQQTSELRRQQLADADEKLKRAIGEPLPRELLKYEMTADALPLVESLAGKLFNRDAPLSPSQGDELARLITSNLKAPAREDEWLRRQVLV